MDSKSSVGKKHIASARNSGLAISFAIHILLGSGLAVLNTDLIKPNEDEAKRRGVTGKTVYDEDGKEWVKREKVQNPIPTRTVADIAKETANAESELKKKQMENKIKIDELKRRLNQGGKGEEKKHYKWAGENRFEFDIRKAQECRTMEIVDEEQRMTFASSDAANSAHGSDLFHAKPAPRRGKSRTPNVWNKLINPDGL